MRDIMDYERIASDAMLEICSERREDLLRDVAVRARAATTMAGGGYRIPRQQRDWGTAQRLGALMIEHGVEVQQADNGDYWIPLAQPYSKFLVEMLEPQRYPEVRLQPGKEILRPYDVATWTLPLAMGVNVERTSSMPAFATNPVNLILEEKASIKNLPRVGIYNPWGGALDEGWTRWLLNQHGYAPKSLHPQEVKAALAMLDVFIVPEVDKAEIATGSRTGGWGAVK